MKLTKAEEEIMHIIRELEPCLVPDTIDHLGKPVTLHSTNSSIVRILKKRVSFTIKPMVPRMNILLWSENNITASIC